jgi:hypothetical protein
VDHAPGVVQPVDVLDWKKRVDCTVGLKQEHEDQGDRDRACYRGKVIGGPEESFSLQELLVEDDRENERDDRLDRHDSEHVVEVVAQTDGEVGPSHTVVGKQLSIVGQPHRF